MSCFRVPGAAAKTHEACANCGKEGKDDGVVKLKNCTACFLVKYCSVDCQRIHRRLHKKACKERAAELKDEKLYGQGHERAEADFCPLCLLAVPFPTSNNSTSYSCCTKMVCKGCCLAADSRGLSGSCPFCRTPSPKSKKEAHEMTQKRADARDPEAIRYLGDRYINGAYGLEKSESRAFELWTEAAELGSTRALTKIGMTYYKGRLGISQDKAKGLRCLESAAMQGDATSRDFLGLVELGNGEYDRAVRHFLISVKMGYKDSLDAMKEMLARGLATKGQYEEALKGYQDAVEEMKSLDRDEEVATRNAT